MHLLDLIAGFSISVVAANAVLSSILLPWTAPERDLRITYIGKAILFTYIAIRFALLVEGSS